MYGWQKFFFSFYGLRVYLNCSVLCCTAEFSSMWSHLSVVGLSSRVLKTVCSCLYIEAHIVLTFSFIGFRVLGLRSRSSIHLELRCMQAERLGPSYILLHVAIQVDHHHLFKMPSFLLCIILTFLSKTGQP